MPGRISTIFENARRENRRCLMPFICAGYPAQASLASIVRAVARGGASAAEIGFPYSDPVADGPVIASAMHDAIGRGVTPAGVLEQVRAMRGEVEIGLIAMVSASILHTMGGLSNAPARLVEAGFDALIVPDLPLEESGPLLEGATWAGVEVCMLVGPATGRERATSIAKATTGFVYLLARAGVTGEQGRLDSLDVRVEQLKSVTQAPIAVGFGIATPEQVRQATAKADAAIVGSALVAHMGEAARRGADVPAAAEAFTRDLAGGLIHTGV